MDLRTLAMKFRDLIRDSQQIEDWCIAYYGQKQNVHVIEDENDLPPQTDYPLIAIMPTEEERSILIEHGKLVLEVDYGLYDENKETLDNVTTLKGGMNLLKFIEIAESQIFAPNADYGGAWIESANKVLDRVWDFPAFTAGVQYVFRNPDRFNPLLPTGS